jgi:hypothetical protein
MQRIIFFNPYQDVFVLQIVYAGVERKYKFL